MFISLNKISLTLFLIFVFCISFDPTGSILKVKEIVFVLLLLVSFPLLKRNHVVLPKICTCIIIICLLFPVWGIILAMMKGNFTDSVYAFGHLKSFLFILIFLFLVNLDFNSILKVLFICGSLIALCTVTIFIVAQVNQELFYSIYIQSVEDSNIIISSRAYYGVDVLGVYFKTGPLMFFSYVYSLYFLRKNRLRLLFILLNLFALLVAGSRTPILMSIFLTVIFCYDKQGNKGLFKLFFLVSSFCVIAFVTYKLATEKGETSNTVKYADFNSYIKELSSGSTFLFGDGLGSEFYSLGKKRLVSYSEQTYMDFIRIYGIVIGGILILAVYYPAIFFFSCKYRDDLKYRRFALAYVLYMVLAGTNPLLISSTGMLVWSIGLTFVYKIKLEQLDLSLKYK